MDALVLAGYAVILAVLSVFGWHRYWILYLYRRHVKGRPPSQVPPAPVPWPQVTVQLPLYNEYYVAERLIDAVCRMDYPRQALEIQVLDDSSDDTRRLVRRKVAEKRRLGFRIHVHTRPERRGFKAGALAEGLAKTESRFIAIFDADFVPPPRFLKDTVPYFSDSRLGMIQARWGHLNADFSLLTRLQALFLDGHFMLEHTARNRAGAFINFNGSGGLWRREAIEDAGGWSADTLTEDLDISYRAQLKGWKFLFLPDLLCSAELPVDMGGFRSQQHRWTKGTLQVAKKILPALWRSDQPPLVKLESTVHLTANLAYPLVLLFSFLLLPSLLARQRFGQGILTWLEPAAFMSTTFSISLFYHTAQKECAPRGIWRWRDLPALMAFGVGMCINNTKAALEALFNIPSGFKRTAKFSIQSGQKTDVPARYRSGKWSAGLLELGLACYFLLSLFQARETMAWASMPFLALFLMGYAYIGFTTFSHNWPFFRE